MLEHIEKYNYIFTEELDDFSKSFPIKYIWHCWLQGEDSAPALVQACLASVQKYHADYKIKLLDYNSVHDFISIPEVIHKKYIQGCICHAHLSDYIRVALIAKYGGTWIDATVYLTQPIPSQILSQDFFAFKSPSWCNLLRPPSINEVFSEQNSARDKRSISNWFLHAKPNNRLIKLIKAFLEAYWAENNTAFDYFMFHLFVSYAILKDAVCQDIFLPMLEVQNAYAHLLQQCQDKEFDMQLYENIKKLSSVHKLIYERDAKVLPNSFTEFLIGRHLKTQ